MIFLTHGVILTSCDRWPPLVGGANRDSLSFYLKISMTRFLILVFLLSCVFIFVGCKQDYHFTGKVLFEDGTPLNAGTVVFESDVYQYDGQIQEDGTYTLGGVKHGSGIPTGHYRVYLTVPSAEDGSLPVHPKFLSGATSDLTFEVTPESPKQFDIRVAKSAD